MRYGVVAAVLGLVASGVARADEPISLGEAMSRARGGAREVTAAKARQEAAAARVNQASAHRLPSLTLSETYIRTDSPAESFALMMNRQEFSFPAFMTSDPNEPGWSGTAITRAEATVPLFTGGELRSDVLAAEAARDDAALRLRQATEVATREAESLQLELQGAEASWAASAGTAEQAARAYAISEVRVRNGLSTLTDLAEARLQLQQAEANRAQAARDLQVTRLRMALLRDLPFGTAASGGF